MLHPKSLGARRAAGLATGIGSTRRGAVMSSASSTDLPAFVGSFGGTKRGPGPMTLGLAGAHGSGVLVDHDATEGDRS